MPLPGISSDMYAKILPPTLETTYLISRLFYERHIYNALDDEMRDVWGCHKILREIEEGHRICIGVFRREDDAFLGFSHGMIYPHNMEAHLLFKRKVNGVEATELCMAKCVEYYKKKKIPLTSFSGIIAENNNAVKRLLRKLGFEDKGILEKEFFFSHGEKISCRFFRKEIK